MSRFLYIKAFIMVCILVLMSGCPYEPEYDAEIIIKNNSNRTIAYLGTFYNWNNYDTILRANIPLSDNIGYNDFNVIEPKTQISLKISKEKYSSTMQEYCGELYYLVDLDTFNAHTWEEIANEFMVLDWYYFETWEDLEAVNFEIVYPKEK